MQQGQTQVENGLAGSKKNERISTSDRNYRAEMTKII
jgi:hypothetical protein